MEHVRILICSPLGEVIKPALSSRFPEAKLVIAPEPDSLTLALTAAPRFDVAVVDLLWNDLQMEMTFDGLDVADLLDNTGLGSPPIVFARQGNSFELDHLDEALNRRHVTGIIDKSAGLDPVVEAITNATTGRNLEHRIKPSDHPLHRYFAQGKGRTAARLAGAIAAGRTTDSASLARVSNSSLDTAKKLPSYLEDLMRNRREIDPDLRMTSEAAYRWCGEHRHYIVSWCRRNGLGGIVSGELGP